ncbi:MAG TPA: aldo/keto reductase [Burkholderiales bacterium]|nr:aldo/keto reductase [Burkholderiales bacterium]
MSATIPGLATRAATERYSQTFGSACAAGHFSDFLNLHLRLSSLGLGTFPGAATDEVDEAYAAIVHRAALAGINVFDTAAHYRYGRSARALGEGLRRAFAGGVAREQVYVVAKGGFLAFDGGAPDDLDRWFDAHVVARGLGGRDDLAGQHCLSAGYLIQQLDAVRAATGLETLDAFLLDQPEVHYAAAGKERAHRKMTGVFEALERAVRDGRIGCYGISSFDAFRVETDAVSFQSLTSLLALAEKAARVAHGNDRARHALRIVQLPFNQAMTEGFTRFSQVTGQGNLASTVQAAHQLRVYAMASHVMGKGAFAAAAAGSVRARLSGLANDARRALQFARSTPGIGTALVGVSTPAHLDDALAVARTAPLERADYLALFERAS